MKTLIVYYSMSGNVEFIAKELAEKLQADTLRLEPETSYPDKGMKKFLWGGKSALMGEKPVLKPYEAKLEDYDRIVIGTPVWASTFAPPIRTFVEENREALKGKEFSAIVCYAGSGAAKAIDKLRTLLGIEAFQAELALIDPKGRPSEKTAESIEDFLTELG